MLWHYTDAAGALGILGSRAVGNARDASELRLDYPLLEIEHGADERQTAFLAGVSAHHLGRPLDLAKGALEQIR